jgi:hypothetical protein
MPTSQTRLRSVAGILIQAAVLGGLALWAVRSEVIHLQEDVPIDPALRAQMPAPGPAPGWELYGVPLKLFVPQFVLVLGAMAVAYAALGIAGFRKRRWPSPGWWLAPLTLGAVGFFVLSYLSKPAILH